jgi:hypothetical protein
MIHKDRFQKMADLRNRCLQEIHKNYSSFDYFMMVDLDLEGPISVDGLASCFYYKDWNMMSAFGAISKPITNGKKLCYYDAMAYVGLKEKPRKFTRTRLVIKAIQAFFIKPFPSRESEPERVLSAFGGCAIYDMKPFRMNPDSLLYSGGTCEHVTLHQKMVKAGYDKLYICPAFLILHVMDDKNALAFNSLIKV